MQVARVRSGACVVAVVALTSACQWLLDPLPRPAAFEGIVTDVAFHVDEGHGATVVVAEVADLTYLTAAAPTHWQTGEVAVSAYVVAGRDTRCFLERRLGLKGVSCERLQEGDRVQVWPVESQRGPAVWPPSYSVEQIVITRD
jgi:hypothetical protein